MGFVTSSCTIVAQCTGVVPIDQDGLYRRTSPSAAEIGVQLKAGTNCGSCIPEMKRLIAQTNVAGAEQRQLARVAN